MLCGTSLFSLSDAVKCATGWVVTHLASLFKFSAEQESQGDEPMSFTSDDWQLAEEVALADTIADSQRRDDLSSTQ